jgi:hypothetical protein
VITIKLSQKFLNFFDIHSCRVKLIHRFGMKFPMDTSKSIGKLSNSMFSLLALTSLVEAILFVLVVSFSAADSQKS